MMILNHIDTDHPPFYRDEELDNRAGAAILENVAKRLFNGIVAAYTAKDEKLEYALAEAHFIVNQRLEGLKK